ncbi:spore germination protein [Paenibacillus sp. CCS19]|uniref:spore germination protein n=1 Tax=Paenibacillus sp. CCS19 TaxID=3158387 RepID=UPI00255FB9E7|nr:spore germination protein [Paenibacillus cellulosilyticus]GMK42363.1 spore germination protein [Paenibacillus cellulosilyticus]
MINMDESETRTSTASCNPSLQDWNELVERCGDVTIRNIPVNEGAMQIHMYYCIGMIDSRELHIGIMNEIERWEFNSDSSMPPIFSRIREELDLESIFMELTSGALIVNCNERWYKADISDPPGRQPEESTMEVSLKGPRDGFVEKLDTNLALVRKRLRTSDLRCEFYSLGTTTKTEVAMLYLDGKARSSIVDEVRNRLKAIDLEAMYSSTQLEELISDRPLSLFPLLDYNGRPDYVVQALVGKRIAILVNGSPSAIIAPASLSLLIKSPEDAHLPYHYVTMERLLRFFGLVLALCVPGFWVALSAFNTDQIPFNLLATVTVSRAGLPISAPMEMFMMLAMFELFREAGVRLPRPVGQTVSVVGGLIVGDAAIRAGLTSPTMLVAAAVTAVATFTLVNQALNGSVSVIRLFILIMSSILGIFGFFVSVFVVLVYMCSLESFGHPFMAPIAPIEWRKLLRAIIQVPWDLLRHRSRRSESR